MLNWYRGLKWKWLCRGFSEIEKLGAELVSFISYYWADDKRAVVIDALNGDAIKAIFAFLGKYDNIERFKLHPMFSMEIMKVVKESSHYTHKLSGEIFTMLMEDIKY